MDKIEIIEVDPEKMGGIPVFKGTRVPIQNLFDYLEGGDSLGTFLMDFPTVTREQAHEVFTVEDAGFKGLKMVDYFKRPRAHLMFS